MFSVGSVGGFRYVIAFSDATWTEELLFTVPNPGAKL